MNEKTRKLVDISELTLQSLHDEGASTTPQQIELLEVLLEQTKEYVENGVSIEEAKFTYEEIAAKFQSDAVKKGAGNRIRRLIKDLNETLETYRPLLKGRLFEKDYRELIRLKSDTRTKPHHHYIELVPFELSQHSTVKKSVPELIQYEPITERSLFGLGKLEITKKFVLISLLFITMPWIALTISLGINASYTDIQPLKIVLTLLLISIIGLTRPLFKLFDNGIIFTPWWLKSTINRTTFLVIKHSDPDEKSRLKIVIRSYRSECPICGANLNIKKGRYQFKGRFIGQCELTSEHSYTFDHVKERGVPALTPMYIPKNL